MILNRFRVGEDDAFIEFDWSQDAKVPKGDYIIRDLWTHKDVGKIDSESGSTWSGSLASHDNWTFRLILEKP